MVPATMNSEETYHNRHARPVFTARIAPKNLTYFRLHYNELLLEPVYIGTSK